MISKYKRVQGLVLISQCFLGHKDSQEETRHAIPAWHTHMLLHCPLFPVCPLVFSAKLTQTREAADRRCSKEALEGWAVQSPQQPKNPRTSREIQTQILAPNPVLLWASCLDAVEGSNLHLRGHPVISSY